MAIDKEQLAYVIGEAICKQFVLEKDGKTVRFTLPSQSMDFTRVANAVLDHLDAASQTAVLARLEPAMDPGPELPELDLIVQANTVLYDSGAIALELGPDAVGVQGDARVYLPSLLVAFPPWMSPEQIVHLSTRLINHVRISRVLAEISVTEPLPRPDEKPAEKLELNEEQIASLMATKFFQPRLGMSNSERLVHIETCGPCRERAVKILRES